MKKRINLIVAEDSTLVRHLLVEQLRSQPDFAVVGTAADGREAVDLTVKLRPDVLILDLEMPRMGGIDAIREVRRNEVDTRILLLTMHKGLKSASLLAGADAALDKDCHPGDLPAAVRRVCTPRPVAATSSSASPMAAATPSASTTANPLSDARSMMALVQLVASHARLSDREAAVLEKAVCTNHTAYQIARELVIEQGTAVTEAAVKNTLSRIMTKLDITPRTRPALIHFVLHQQLSH